LYITPVTTPVPNSATSYGHRERKRMKTPSSFANRTSTLPIAEEPPEVTAASGAMVSAALAASLVANRRKTRAALRILRGTIQNTEKY
jgi:hypothetical protein